MSQTERTGSLAIRRQPPWTALLIFLLLACAIAVSGFYYYRQQKKNVFDEQITQLKAVADLKAAQIENWLGERKGDARMIMENPFLKAELLAFLRNRSTGPLQEPIRGWMASLLKNYHYQNILLLDASGEVALALGGAYPVIGSQGLELMEAARRRKQPIISELHHSPQVAQIHLDVVVPLLSGGDAKGFVFLRIDPADYLYPMIQSWPTPSPSAETLLVRRDGDEILFLNELRHQKHTALTLRMPIGRLDLPAARAVLGQTGAFAGRDYRGIPVWSVTLPVPETSWFIVAKVDRGEIERPMRRNALVVSMVALFLILAAAAVTLFLWQRQTARFFQRQLEAENRRQALVQHFDYLTRYANDIILLADEKWNIVEANERALLTYGHGRDALLQMNLRDLRAPAERDTLDAEYRRTEERLGSIFETRHLKKDGSVFPVEVSARVIAVNEKKFFQNIIRDISERKQTEEKLRETEAKFRQTFEFSPVGIVMVGLDRRFLRCNKAFSESLGYSPEELIGKTIADLTYPDDVHIGMDEMKAIARGELAVSQVQKRYLHKDGRIIWGETTISLIRDHQADHQYFMAVIQDISKRKSAEDALQESQRQISLIYNTVGDIIFNLKVEKDGNYYFTSINQRFLQSTGLQTEQIIGKKVQDVIPEPSLSMVLGKYAEAIRSRKLVRWEETTDYPTGRVVGDVSIDPVLDEAGDCIALVGSVHDITERKRAEEKLRLAHERIRQIIDSNIIGMVIANSKGQIIETNDFYLDMIGYTREEFAKGLVNWREITPPEWLPIDEKALGELQRRGSCTPYEKEYVRKDGTRVPVYLADALLAGPEEEIVAFVIDLTERKRAEEALRDSEKRLRETQEMARLGHWQWDIKTGKVEWSDEVYRIFQLAPGAFIPQIDSILALSPWPEDHARDQELIRRAMETHEKGTYEQRFLRPDNSIGYYLSTFQGNYDDGGDLIAIVGTVLDITERKQAEEEIRKLNAELEDRVAKRTGQLESANKELEAFSYSVSHDLRAPLRAIDGFSRILLEEYAPKLDDEGRRLFDVIRDNTRKMGQLIDDLLAFSRLSRQPMAVAPVDLAALAGSIFAELKTAEKGRKIELVVAALPIAFGDRSMLRQVMQNLLANAIKFTRPLARARIELTGRTENGEHIYRVRDNGVGFDMNYADKLFGVFQRLHGSDEFEGTGVGLAIVQRIILRHGGRVWAESTARGGATFYFTLPAAAGGVKKPENGEGAR